MIVDNLVDGDAKARRKLVWLANYHNRFVAELRNDYDMDDPHGEFEAELDVSPSELFDSLVIEGSWTSIISRLEAVAGDVGQD